MNEQAERDLRIEKLNKLKEFGFKVYEDKVFSPFTLFSFIKEHYYNLAPGQHDPEKTFYYLVGKIINKRIIGSLAFLKIEHEGDFIQLYISKDEFNSFMTNKTQKVESINYLKQIIDKLIDIGDNIGVKGYVKKTDKGELFLFVKEFEVLSKSLLPYPDKYLGLNEENSKNNRSLSLIINPESRDIFIKRHKVINQIRNFLNNQGFIEIETPILQSKIGGAYAKPFITYHNASKKEQYLRIATELYLKRAIIGGFNQVYEIGKIFKNEGVSYKHNPEFTSIEIYRTYEDYNQMMNFTKELIKNCFKKLGSPLIISKNKINEIDLTSNWKEVTMNTLVKEYTNLDILNFNNLNDAKKAVDKLSKLDLSNIQSLGELLYFLFETFVESNLIQPTFVIDYPIEVSPSSKRKSENSLLTERFELFIDGNEIANGSGELIDPIDQKQRFLKQALSKTGKEKEADIEAFIDYNFINSMEYGMPPTVSLGIEIDRLVMLLTNNHSIKDVIMFPYN